MPFSPGYPASPRAGGICVRRGVLSPLPERRRLSPDAVLRRLVVLARRGDRAVVARSARHARRRGAERGGGGRLTIPVETPAPWPGRSRTGCAAQLSGLLAMQIW